MKKKTLLLLNYFVGTGIYFESPVFFGNALYWLKAYLETFPEITDNFEIEIVNFEHMSYLNHGATNEENINVLNAVLSHQPDAVAFSLYVWNVAHAHELASVIKEMAPEVVTIAGGPEVHDRADFSRDFPAFDVLVEGDGEIPLKAVLARLADENSDLSGIPNVSCRRDDAFVHNESSLVFPDIEDIPNFYESNRSLITGRGFYLTTRGCPYNCDMCLWARQPMRKKSSERILEELHSLIDGTGLSFLTLFDYDLLEAYREDTTFFRALQDMVQKKGNGFGINFFVNPRYMVDGRLRDVVDALNPNHILVGLQSTCDESLKAINRGWSIGWLDAFEKVARDLRALFHVELIFPLPGQSADQFVESVKYLLGLGYFRLQIFHLCVLRGTALYRKRAELGLRYQKNPPYTCYATPAVSAQDFLRVGVLCQVLNIIRDIADFLPDNTPFVEYFTRTPDAVDRILDLIDRRTDPGEVARYLVKEILSVDYQGSFYNAEYKSGGPGPSCLRELCDDAAVSARHDFRFEEDIRRFFRTLDIEQVEVIHEPDALRLRLQSNGRDLEIVLFPKRIGGPHFKSTRFYKVSYSGSREDIGIVEQTIGFIRQLEKKASR